jgi:hypothetical protein
VRHNGSHVPAYRRSISSTYVMGNAA